MLNTIDYVGIVAAFAAAVAATVAAWQFHQQRRFNRLSITPIAQISTLNLVQGVRVYFENVGTGPLVLRELRVKGPDGVENSIIEHLPKPPAGVYWERYAKYLDGKVFLPGDRFPLLVFDVKAKKPESKIFLDEVRLVLSQLKVKVEYVDIYHLQDNTAKTNKYEKKLKAFELKLTHDADVAEFDE